MKKNLGLSRTLMLSLVSGVSLSLLAIAPVQAQSTIAIQEAKTIVSTVTLKVAGSALPRQTGLKETVDFAGPLVVTATVLVDPALPPSLVVSIDGLGIQGVGATTGTIYVNELEANLTRLFAATDSTTLTFAFFESKEGSYLSARTGLLTVNLAFDKTTMMISTATATIGAPSTLGAAF
jgi:hypothetical protein